MAAHRSGLTPHADATQELVGDADRDAAVKRLQRSYVEGRVTADELVERLGLALTSRTVADLAAARHGLPTPVTRAAVDRRRTRSGTSLTLRRPRLAAAAAVLSGVAAWWFS
jgi:hypothetical protein